MNLDGFTFDQHRLERLNAQAMQSGRAIEQDGMIFDYFFQNVPNHRILLLYQFLSLLDRGAMAALFQAMINERLEQLERHLLGQPALMQLELRAYDNY